MAIIQMFTVQLFSPEIPGSGRSPGGGFSRQEYWSAVPLPSPPYSPTDSLNKPHYFHESAFRKVASNPHKVKDVMAGYCRSITFPPVGPLEGILGLQILVTS